MTIPDLIERLIAGPSRSLDVGLHLNKYQALCKEAADLLIRLIAPDDEGLETTEGDLIALEELERGETLKGVDIDNIGKLIRDFDLISAKLRAAEERVQYLQALAEEQHKKDVAEISRLQGEVVFGFYEEEVPVFIQGYENRQGINELCSPVTADEVTGYVRKIVQLRTELQSIRRALNTETRP
jgi:(p)ppGpp synthase/HD superfamily hydrolase